MDRNYLILASLLLCLLLSCGCDQNGNLINPTDMMKSVHSASLPAMTPNMATDITPANSNGNIVTPTPTDTDNSSLETETPAPNSTYQFVFV